MRSSQWPDAIESQVLRGSRAVATPESPFACVAPLGRYLLECRLARRPFSEWKSARQTELTLQH